MEFLSFEYSMEPPWLFWIISHTIPTFQCPTFNAADLRVPGVALGAEADGLVVVDEALGVGPAVAGVHAVTVEAGLSLATVIICGATNNNHSWNYEAFYFPKGINLSKKTEDYENSWN